MSKPDKREPFVRLAECRVDKILHYLELLGNLSQSHKEYEYTDADIIKIKSAIKKELDKAMNKFEKQTPVFSFNKEVNN